MTEQINGPLPEELQDCPGSGKWRTAEGIAKGWSGDRKYAVTDADGARLLLRLTDKAQTEAKQKEFAMLGEVARLGLQTPRPLAFGLCNAGESVYMLLSWVDGQDLETVLGSLPPERQRRLGVEAGEALKAIHGLKGEEAPIGWEQRLREQIGKRISRYENCPHRVGGDETAIAFVRKHIDSLEGLGWTFRHGDFHTNNLLLAPDGGLGIIDFNRCDHGDPYDDFYKMQSFSREISIPFCLGQLEGYFGGEPPHQFWKVLAVYNAYIALHSIVWAMAFGTAEVEGMQKRAYMTFADYDGFRNPVPRWYRESGDVACG